MTLPLPATLDTAAAAPLRLSLLELIDRGEPLSLRGDAVEQVGLACLQVLAAAARAAARAGLAFTVIGASPVLAEMAALAAISLPTA